MRISYRWLRKYLNFEIPTRDLIDALIMGGFEIRGTLDLGYGGEPIVVGLIEEAAAHPSAEGISLLKVAAGEGPLRNVVWVGGGVSVGERAPLALPGARLASGIEVTERTVQGQLSEGLLCTGADLGWGAETRRPLLLSEDYGVGQPLDFLIDLLPPTNRPDCLSVFGVARDIAARFGKKVYPPSSRFSESMDHIESYVAVAVRARERCYRYTERVIKSVRLDSSPLWLRRALESAGVQSVNNIVDAVNYAMLDLGQPVVAYDLDKVAGNQLFVRLAEEGETVKLANNLKVTLSSDDLVVADPTKVAAVAGIMLAANLELTESTVNVLLESAIYAPGPIRQTARRLGLSTDLSFRYERGFNRDKTPHSLNLATYLIKELTGGEVAKGMIDLVGAAPSSKPIALDLRRANAMLGLQLKGREVADILVALGFEILHYDNEIMTINVPTHRVDVAHEMDLIEEVARLYGYDRIPATMPRLPTVPKRQRPEVQLATAVRDCMTGMGFFEAVSPSFITEKQIEDVSFPLAQCLTGNGAATEPKGILRPMLAPSLMDVFHLNHSRGVVNLRLFETAHVYRKSPGEGEPEERLSLTAGMSGVASWHWRAHGRMADYYDIKGAAEQALAAAGVERVVAASGGPPFLHPGRSARLTDGAADVGWVGEVHPGLRKELDLASPLYLFEIDLSACLALFKPMRQFEETPKFPAIERSIRIAVDETATAASVEKTIREAGGPLLQECALFDFAQGGPGASEDMRILAHRLVFRAPDRAIGAEEANGLVDGILEALQDRCGAEARP